MYFCRLTLTKAVPTKIKSLMSNTHHLVLASTSPRRRAFMSVLGLPFTAVSPSQIIEVDETPFPQEPPDQLVQRLSRRKALTVAKNIEHYAVLNRLNQTHHLVVIAADTVVALGNTILGKPETANQATEMLKALRRRVHDVYSGLTVVDLPQLAASGTQSITTCRHHSQVWMRRYTDAEIAAYVATGSPLDKAGAYGIQDKQFAPVERLDGCFASVMGLPFAELVTELRRFNIPFPATPTLCRRHTGIPCCQKPEHDRTS